MMQVIRCRDAGEVCRQGLRKVEQEGYVKASIKAGDNGRIVYEVSKAGALIRFEADYIKIRG